MTDAAEPLIIAENLCLSFPSLTPSERKLMTSPIKFLTDFYFSRPVRKDIEVLHDLNFTICSGDRLALIGHNGAGKSTLLRVLSGVYTPTKGRFTVNGSAKGLFDVASGMSLEATGLENIYLRGLQMGMTMKEIKQKVPAIAEFTQLGNDLNKLFDTYSTGMRLRLAFAISTMIEPDILLMDEWLGAGDARFKDKVEDRMDGLIRQSRALVLASHSVELLGQLCNKGLVLDQGRQMFFGPLEDAVAFYDESVAAKA